MLRLWILPHSKHLSSRNRALSESSPGNGKRVQSGNPAGRVKNDFAAEIARAVFEENKELVYQSMAKMIKNGSAFGFQVLSDRAYGKLTEKVQHSGEISLAERIERGRKKVAESKSGDSSKKDDNS